MHAPVSRFPLLPPSEGAVDECGGGRLRKPCRLAGGADFIRCWVPRRATGPAAGWVVRQSSRPSCH